MSIQAEEPDTRDPYPEDPDPVDTPHELPPLPEEHLVDALPAIARLAAETWMRAAAWGLTGSVRVARAATDPDAASQLVHDVSSGLRAYAREFLGVTDLDDRVARLAPPPGEELTNWPRRVDTGELLLAQGTELLRQAADVHFDGEAHPAYGRILTEIVPDEGRMLRLLATAGSQPLVDVRAGNLIGPGSQLIAPGLNMIGAQAGLRHRDRVAAYLGNLFRLGLIAFSEAPVEDPIAYQVLEAQPEVLTCIKQTTRARTAHRSVVLTAFGVDFCHVCLPLNAGPERIDGATTIELTP
jgi:Abortive infection alpha